MIEVVGGRIWALHAASFGSNTYEDAERAIDTMKRRIPIGRRLPDWLRPARFLAGFTLLVNVGLAAFVLASGDDPAFIPYMLAVSLGASVPAGMIFGLVRQLSPHGRLVHHWGAWAFAAPIGFLLVLVLSDLLAPASESGWLARAYLGSAVGYVIAASVIWGVLMAWAELRHLRRRRLEEADLDSRTRRLSSK